MPRRKAETQADPLAWLRPILARADVVPEAKLCLVALTTAPEGMTEVELVAATGNPGFFVDKACRQLHALGLARYRDGRLTLLKMEAAA